MSHPAHPDIRIGVSACLIGERVRYDGNHSRHDFIAKVLSRKVTLIPVCPESEIGMGTPREPVQLEGTALHPAMRGVESGHDWTQAMLRYARRRCRQDDLASVHGFIFKSKSPSCGVRGVKVFPEQGRPSRAGQGLFAATFMSAYPMVPTVAETALNSPGAQEHFLTRVAAYYRLKHLLDSKVSAAQLKRFHQQETTLLRAHSPRHCRQLNRLVDGLLHLKPAESRRRYAMLYTEALSLKTTHAKQVRALRKLYRDLKRTVPQQQSEHIGHIIEAFTAGAVALETVLAEFRGMHEAYPQEEMAADVYLYPPATGLTASG